MTTGTVKFFNLAKGFGFIAPDDGGADIFVHVSAVERSGLAALGDGDQVAFEIEQDRRSGKLAAVDLQIIAHATAGTRARSFNRQGQGFRGPARSDHGSAPGTRGGAREPAGSGAGVVKWFNPSKGFGFISPDDGGADVFVHISVVERSGLSDLHEGQTLAYDLEADRRTGKLSASNLRPI